MTTNERFERIERAYLAALAGRDPATVWIFDLLPAIYEAVPDTNTYEIADVLRWRRDRLARNDGEAG